MAILTLLLHGQHVSFEQHLGRSTYHAATSSEPQHQPALLYHRRDLQVPGPPMPTDKPFRLKETLSLASDRQSADDKVISVIPSRC